MRLHRSQTALLLAAVGLSLLAAQPASAEPYPAPAPPATVSDGTVSDDGAVTFSGTGFIPGETINIDVTYHSSSAAGLPGTTGRSSEFVNVGFVTAALPVPEAVVATTTANGSGSFSVRVQLTQVGVAALTAIGVISGHTVSASVRVLARGRSDGSGLAVTGDSGSRLAYQIGGALVAILLGTALIWFGARRRRRVDA
jgi:hypothetical protein